MTVVKCEADACRFNNEEGECAKKEIRLSPTDESELDCDNFRLRRN